MRYFLILLIGLVGCSPTNIINVTTYPAQSAQTTENNTKEIIIDQTKTIASQPIQQPQANIKITGSICSEPFKIPDIGKMPEVPLNVKKLFDKEPDQAVLKLGTTINELRNYIDEYNDKIKLQYAQYVRQCKKY